MFFLQEYTKLMKADIKFLNALNAIPLVGPATLRLLKERFGSYEEAWRAGEGALRELSLDTRILQAILWKRASLHPDREMEKLVREGVWIITEGESDFPQSLREIPYPPVILYARGRREALAYRSGAKLSIAVVGTRRPSHYGLEIAEQIVSQLVAGGCSVVSGLAMGIDGRAHEAALEARGVTIAVLGSGINQDSIFPPEHRGLARRIAESNGVVVSEYAHGTPALKEHFPQRNRIIAGLSRGVVVVEAREKSGALITARLALEQNREVFAIPGPIFSPTSAGPNRLIQDGAKLVRNAADIFAEFGIEYTKESREGAVSGFSPEEQKIWAILEEPLTVDVIKEKSALATPAIIATLSMFELKGLVKNLGQGVYQKVV